MLAIILSLLSAVVLFTTFLIVCRPSAGLPKPEARCIVRNEPPFQAGKMKS